MKVTEEEREVLGEQAPMLIKVFTRLMVEASLEPTDAPERKVGEARCYGSILKELGSLAQSSETIKKSRATQAEIQEKALRPV